MATFLGDLRHAIRLFGRERGATAMAVLALALGIGATTAIYTVVHAVLLRPLPYADPDRIVVALHGAAASNPVSPADFLDYRRDARSFARLAAAQAWGGTLTGGERPEIVSALQVTADLFPLLGVEPLAGRTFVEGEDHAGRDRVVVLSHSLWQRRFGGDRGAIGQTIAISGEPYVIVGVMPPAFRFAPFWQTRAEMWVPLSLDRRMDDRSGRSLRVFGRLRDGVSVEQAQAELGGIAGRLSQTFPDTNTGISITVRPLLDKVVSGIRGTLVALMAMVSFVLLIACANVANALLARASGRQREIGVRLAIGASHGRVIRQMLTESLLLACAGSVAGLLLAFVGVDWLLAMLPPGSLPRQQEVAFDPSIFAFASVATLVTGVATGLAPALQFARGSVAAAFQDGGKGATESAARKRVRAALVAVEVALAIVLLVGAGLMARTMWKLNAVEPGFEVEQVAVADLSLLGTPHARPENRQAMFARLRERLAALPGVTAVGAINHLPLAGDVWNLGYRIEGRPLPPPGQRTSAVYRIVQPGYFAAMQLPLAAGRDFADSDRAASPHVAIVNQAMADRHWPNESPIGRRIFLPGVSEVQAPITVIGVAANARQRDWTGPPDDEVYLAYAQRSSEFGLAGMTFVLRTSADPARLAASIPREVSSVDRGVAVSSNTTLASVVSQELWRERLTARLTAIFAAVALGLAGIGIYAVVSYSVARRTREFGVRVALGATGANVIRLALREALVPVAIGAVVGLAGAMGATRLIATLLFEVSAADPIAIGSAILTLIGVAVAAAWLPAVRASRLDPVAALRRDT